MTKQQNAAAKKAFEEFRANCQKLGADRNRHDGVAAFMIARSLMRCTLGLKYYQAEKWALNWLAQNWS